MSEPRQELDYVTADEMRAWMAYHGIDLDDVVEMFMGPDEFRGGPCIRFTVHYKDPETNQRMAGRSSAITEERVVRLKSLPGQETMSFLEST